MAIILDIKVVPSSGRQQITIDKSGRIKCFLKSAPERGKANEELIKFFASQLKLTRQDIEIVFGLTDRNKKIKILTTLSQEQVMDKLGLGVQSKFVFGK